MARAASLIALENARAYQRYETGENRPDAHIVERIINASDGMVRLEDLHAQRLQWLTANRPDLLANAEMLNQPEGAEWPADVPRPGAIIPEAAE